MLFMIICCNRNHRRDNRNYLTWLPSIRPYQRDICLGSLAYKYFQASSQW